MTPALILTLDKTLTSTLSGKEVSLHAEDWKFNNQAVQAIKDYAHRGYKILIVSNQLAITNNLLPEKSFLRKMNLIVNTLEKDLNIPQNFICYSYCTDKESYNFIPRPGLIYEFALDFEIDLYNSVLIGSSVYDKSLASYSGIKTYIEVSSLTYSI